MNKLVLPEVSTTPQRRDELWRTTCCELFMQDSGEGYCELNFSPSGDWAAYHFSGYRAGMQNSDLPPPLIRQQLAAARYSMTVKLAPSVLRPGALLALAVVVEQADGQKSYWALHHGAGAPDFHHPDCFRLRLGAPATS